MKFTYKPTASKKVAPNYKTQYLKKITIPKDFTMVIDTREQLPLTFQSGVETISSALKNGDYSVHGYEHLIAFERKQMSDLTPYISVDHENTTKKKERFKQMVLNGGFVALVVDKSDYRDILKGYQYGGLTPAHYETFISRWQTNWGFHFFASRSSEELARWVLKMSVEWVNWYRENQKNEANE